VSTNIEWTDVTDNIIAVEGGGWWCRKISPGCAHCYAARLNQNSFFGGNKLAYSGDVPPLFLRKDLCDGWARQRVPKRHFVASMTDVFGEWVPQEWIFYFLDAMAAAPLQTFQVLTKRPEGACQAIHAWLETRRLFRLPQNIWIGVSVENQAVAEIRVPLLLAIRAEVHFLSCEPLLGPVNLDSDLGGTLWMGGQRGCHGEHHGVGTPDCPRESHHHCDHRCKKGLDWVICGGESGKRARPMDVTWAKWLMEQCRYANVPFFMKQMGGERKPFRPIPESLLVREFPQQEVRA
jgi:protein gp37